MRSSALPPYPVQRKAPVLREHRAQTGVHNLNPDRPYMRIAREIAVSKHRKSELIVATGEWPGARMGYIVVMALKKRFDAKISSQ
jgi:hypothetical protein